MIVKVFAGGLILDEGNWVGQLTDVVVVGRGSDQKWISPDCRRGAFAQVADHQRMVVRAGRLGKKTTQERLRRIGKLKQLRPGQDPEQVPQKREATERDYGGNQGTGDCGSAQLEHAGHVVLTQEGE